MDDKSNIIVIDCGSGSIKAGRAVDDSPRAVFEAVVGHPVSQNGAPYKYVYDKDCYVGDDVYRAAGFLRRTFPIEHGIVTNWDDMEKIWYHMFRRELWVHPSEHPVLMSEHHDVPKLQREKTMQIMFETFSVPSFCVAQSTYLDLYSSGRNTGCVVDCGHGMVDVCSVYEGKELRNMKTVHLAGLELTAFFEKLLGFRGYLFSTAADKEVVREMKEKLTYVAFDFDEEMKKAESSSECNIDYTLPDGNIITLGNERFRCPELLFKPHLNGFHLDSIEKTVCDSIMECDIDIRKDLFANIILAGGTTMFKGLPERMEREITRLAPPNMKVKIVAPPERKYATWIGGSIHASLATFPQMVITHEEYNEVGPSIVHRKCP